MNLTDGVPLKTFAEGRKQDEVAALIGMTQGSVSQMLKSERGIWVRKLEDGSYQAYELRPVGRRTPQQQEAA